MHILSYNQIGSSDEMLQLGDELITKVLPRLAQEYNFVNGERTFNQALLTLAKQLGYVLATLSNNPYGRTILDLGCGYNPSEEERRTPSIGRRDEPWLCRALHLLGIKIIGVDYGNLDGELFEHYQVDLLHQDLPPDFPDKSIDLVNASNLFSSLRIKLIERKSEELKDHLIPQLERIVKEDGTFIYLD